MGRPVSGRHEHFFDAGGHSLLALRLLAQVHETFGVEVTPHVFMADPRLSALAAAIDAQRANTGGERVRLVEIIVPIQPEGSRPPLFCCFSAGGVTFMYYPLAPLLGKDQPLYALQDPALDDTRDPARSMEEIASECVEAIRKVSPNGPYHLCGYSFGGTLAYEIACQLEAAGETVRRLILLDAHAAFGKKAGGYNWGSTVMRLSRYFFVSLALIPSTARFIAEGFGILAVSTHTGDKGLQPLAERRRLRDYIRERYAAMALRRMGAVTVTAKNEMLLAMELPRVRRVFYLFYWHEQANLNYRPRPYGGAIDLLRATEHSRLVPTRNDPELGWGAFARGGVRIYPVEANHVQMLSPRCLGQVAEYLRRLLDNDDERESLD